MQRKLNSRFLLVSIGATVLFVVVVALIHNFQLRRNAGAFLRQADRFRKEGNYHRAAFYYQHYLEYEPGNTDALIRYALTLDQAAISYEGIEQAFEIMEQALRRAPNNEELRKATVEAAIDLYDYPAAIEHLNYLLEQKPKDSGLWQLLGLCQEWNLQFEAAVKSYQKSIEANPKELLSYAYMVNIYRYDLDRPTEAVKVLDQMVANNSESFVVHLTRGKYQKDLGNKRKAWKDLQKAYQLAPDNLQVIYPLVLTSRLVGKLDYAREVLLNSLQKHPKVTNLYLGLSGVELQAKQPQKAIHWLQEGRKKLPKSLPILLKLADLQIEEKLYSQAEKTISDIRRQTSNQAIADGLSAHSWVKEEKWEQARIKLEAILSALSAHPRRQAKCEILLGQCYSRLGDHEKALACCQRAVSLDPDWTFGRYSLGLALLNNGKVAEAIPELRVARNTVDAPASVSLILARALIDRELGKAAEDRDWQEIQDILAEEQTRTPGEVEITLLQAKVFSAQDKRDKARSILLEAKQNTPNEPKVWFALADLARQEGKLRLAGALLEQAQATFGRSIRLQLAWLRFWEAQSGEKADVAFKDLGRNLEGLQPDEKNHFLQELALAYQRRGDLKAANSLWKTLSKNNAGDLQTRVQMFDLALQEKDAAAAEKILDEIRRIEGDQGIRWRYGKAIYLISFAKKGEQEKLKQAKKLLRELRKQKPDWNQISLLEGAVEEFGGNERSAIAHYDQALKTAEVSPPFLTRYIRLLFRHGEYLKADYAIRKLEKKAPLPNDIAQMAAETALQINDKERAVQLAKKAVEADSRDYREQLWLARVLNLGGYPQEAETVLRKAVMQSSFVPDTWISLIHHLKRHGKTAETEAFLKQIPDNLATNRVQFTLGRCYEILGDLEKAEAAFQQHYSRYPDHFVSWRHLGEFYLRTKQFAKAEPLLRKLVDPKNAVPAGIAHQARQHLALALGKQNHPEKFREALELLPPGQETQSGRILRAFILAESPEHSVEATRILEKQKKITPLGPEGTFVLARIYHSAGKLEKAGSLLLPLVIGKEADPEYRELYIRNLLAREEVNSAKYHLNLLRKQSPKHPNLEELEQETKRMEKQIQSRN